MSTEQIEQVRRFNRTVTQRVGAISDRFLTRDRPIGLSRLLWEIGVEGCEVRTLRSRLGLDSGQLSRMLRALESEGLVEVVPSAEDGRIRVARLTVRGRTERELLDERSDELAASILDPLDPARRDELVAAMRKVERLLTSSLVTVDVEDPETDDARRCLRAYVAEISRRAGRAFDPTQGATVAPHEVRPPQGAFLVARLRGEPIGCGGVKHPEGSFAEIKRVWVAESARGLGLGRRLLEELEGRARDAGATHARLDTNDTLVEAIALYRSAGYTEIPRYNAETFADRWFEKRL